MSNKIKKGYQLEITTLDEDNDKEILCTLFVSEQQYKSMSVAIRKFKYTSDWSECYKSLELEGEQ